MDKKKLLVIPLLGLIIMSGVAAVLAQEGLPGENEDEGLAEAEDTAQEQGTGTTEGDEAGKVEVLLELRIGFLTEAKAMMQDKIDLLNEDITKEQFKGRLNSHISAFRENRGQYIEGFRTEGCSAVEHHWMKTTAFMWDDDSFYPEVENRKAWSERFPNLDELKNRFSELEWEDLDIIKLSQLLEDMSE